jgi:feruloyl esterase
LSSLAVPNAVIKVAQAVRAGEFTPPPEFNQRVNFADLPAFCRVVATLTPSSDSDVGIEVWLPVNGWNGKFEGVGNGGYAGGISYRDLAAAVRRGYAVANTDTGHKGDNRDASFALGHPEKALDFAFRSVHEMTVKGKAIVKAFYGSAPRFSYWSGCSTGGRQAMVEAQMYPDDYDGIVAGAPGNDTTQLSVQSMGIAQVVHRSPENYLPPPLYSVIHQAVLSACDAMDGVKDGVLENPAVCNFDPQALACKSGADPSTCLTPAQVETARTIYDPNRNPRTRLPLALGLQRGSELNWGSMAGPEPFFHGLQFWKYMVFKDANWDYKSLETRTALGQAAKEESVLGDATSVELKPFFARGGKLIQYHGWSDQNIPPENSIRYYKRAADTLASALKVADSYRLFMVPGMAHCGGGEGTDNFDMLSALEQWRENGKAPENIPASRIEGAKVVRTRPLCPYPQQAIYKGSGSTDQAENFYCAVAPAKH